MNNSSLQPILGLTGEVFDITVAVPAAETVFALCDTPLPAELDLPRMAAWALHYLIHTPRPELDYEPVFQCYPLACPPTPAGHDVVVPCDTDARMEWEWYFMREMSGSDAGRDVEAAFHAHMRKYVDDDGRVWSHVGCYNEADIDHIYTDEDLIYHVWGAAKIMKSLAEEFRVSGKQADRELARKIMLALRTLTKSDAQGRCWLPAGMGAVGKDGLPLPNGWNAHPLPVIEPLLTYYQATGDAEGLAFARAYADGVVAFGQPGGIHFAEDGSFADPLGHSHATMHTLWGIAHLGIVLGEAHYIEFARRAWDWLLSRGTGTGWFPAGPDNCNETCCVSDMISNAVCIGRLHPQYYDFAERYFRNYIAPLQFIVTPEFETYYRSLHLEAAPEAVEAGLHELRKFQGGVIGASGLNAYENELLHAHGFCMFGCCAPEGMRALHTVWSETIAHHPASPFGPAGVYVNMSLNRESRWGRVVSFVPEQGRISVQAHVAETFFLRPPHWAPRDQVLAFHNGERIATAWSGEYVLFNAQPDDELTITFPLLTFTHRVAGLWPNCALDLQITFQWRGNMVVSADPPAELTALFSATPRQLPPAAEEATTIV